MAFQVQKIQSNSSITSNQFYLYCGVFFFFLCAFLLIFVEFLFFYFFLFLWGGGILLFWFVLLVFSCFFNLFNCFLLGFFLGGVCVGFSFLFNVFFPHSDVDLNVNKNMSIDK